MKTPRCWFRRFRTDNEAADTSIYSENPRIPLAHEPFRIWELFRTSTNRLAICWRRRSAANCSRIRTIVRAAAAQSSLIATPKGPPRWRCFLEVGVRKMNLPKWRGAFVGIVDRWQGRHRPSSMRMLRALLKSALPVESAGGLAGWEWARSRSRGKLRNGQDVLISNAISRRPRQGAQRCGARCIRPFADYLHIWRRRSRDPPGRDFGASLLRYPHDSTSCRQLFDDPGTCDRMRCCLRARALRRRYRLAAMKGGACAHRKDSHGLSEWKTGTVKAALD